MEVAQQSRAPDRGTVQRWRRPRGSGTPSGPHVSAQRRADVARVIERSGYCAARAPPWRSPRWRGDGRDVTVRAPTCDGHGGHPGLHPVPPQQSRATAVSRCAGKSADWSQHSGAIVRVGWFVTISVAFGIQDGTASSPRDPRESVALPASPFAERRIGRRMCPPGVVDGPGRWSADPAPARAGRATKAGAALLPKRTRRPVWPRAVFRAAVRQAQRDNAEARRLAPKQKPLVGTSPRASAFARAAHSIPAMSASPTTWGARTRSSRTPRPR